ncbi:MAG: ATP-dependent metallopeptidase FtsH/Yme1/Tma family protein [Solirubrobacteraceae bacterium]
MSEESPERRSRPSLQRGTGEEPKKPGQPARRVRPRFWVIVLVLLAVNYLSVALFAPGKERSVRVPYSPEFLSQVREGNVQKISSTGATVSGEFKKEVTYPPGDKEAEPAKNFDTEIPAFANTDQLDQLLRDRDVEISAEPINPGRGVLMNVILGFGPVILLVALFIWLARRAGGG